MKIDLKKEEKKLTIKLDGKLDTNTLSTFLQQDLEYCYLCKKL